MTDQLVEIINALAWPGTVVLLGGGSIRTFRQQIAGFITRATRLTAGPQGAAIEAANAERQQGEASSATDIPALPVPAKPGTPALQRPDSSPVYDAHDADLRSRLDNTFGSENFDLKLTWAIRVNSANLVERIHETNYRLMYTAQIFALKRLNEQIRVPLSKQREVYDAAAAQNPEFYALVSWETWSNFLRSTGYVNVGAEPDPIVTLTPLGKDFLVWMVGRGVPEHKTF